MDRLDPPCATVQPQPVDHCPDPRRAQGCGLRRYSDAITVGCGELAVFSAAVDGSVFGAMPRSPACPNPSHTCERPSPVSVRTWQRSQVSWRRPPRAAASRRSSGLTRSLRPCRAVGDLLLYQLAARGGADQDVVVAQRRCLSDEGLIDLPHSVSVQLAHEVGGPAEQYAAAFGRRGPQAKCYRAGCPCT